jgi:hypothetical protein
VADQQPPAEEQFLTIVPKAATGVLFDVCSITKIHYNTTINSQNQFENNKCITFASASSSLILFSNASAFAVASSRSFIAKLCFGLVFFFRTG